MGGSKMNLDVWIHSQVHMMMWALPFEIQAQAHVAKLK